MASLRRYLVGTSVVALAACSYPELDERFPSCARLPPTCGANHDESCCTSLEVPGGSYRRGHDMVMDAPATVGGFRLDKYEVVVGRFSAFVMAGMGTRGSAPDMGRGAHARIPGSGWDTSWNANLEPTPTELTASLVRDCDMYPTWTDQSQYSAQRPINCVTWFEAMAFCIWDGGYLPTEAEWNYAAAGGDDQRLYPWSTPAGSTEITASYLSFTDDDGHCPGDGVLDCNQADLLPVGSKPSGDGRWGQSDLAGNVWEWTLDWFSDTYQAPCTDCAQLAPGTTRVSRGGSYGSNRMTVQTGHRGGDFPTTGRSHFHGFRCARALN